MNPKTFPSRLLVATAAALALGVSGCSAIASDSEPAVPQETITADSEPSSAMPQEGERCRVETELSSMPLEQKIGQLLTVGVTGTDDARTALDQYHVGGVFIGSDVAEQMLTSNAVTELRRSSGLRPLTAIDEEGGRVSRIAPIVGEMMSPREMARNHTPDEVRAMAKERGDHLRRMGITVDFAPSIDVSSQDDDEVIGDRSFSDDPQVVVEYARAFAEGLLEAGITPVFKHFPGHGHSSGDSHLEHVTVPPLEELQQNDLIPFRELLGMEGTAVMVGHMEVPGFTDPGRPATVSKQVYDLLRQGTDFGGQPYDGVIFTDDLSGMKAITDQFTVPEAVVESLIAGADSPLWISTVDLPATVEAVKAAVQDGRLTEDRLVASLERLNKLRAAQPCGE